MICIGEPMRFVADALEQTQRGRIHWKSQWQRSAGPVNLLVFLSQTNDRNSVQAQTLQFATGRGKLTFAAIDNDQIWQAHQRLRITHSGYRIGLQTARCVESVFLGMLGRKIDNGIQLCAFRSLVSGFRNAQEHPRVSSSHDFSHAGEIVLSFNCSHPISPVIILVRHAVAETNHRSDDVRRGNVRDIEALHHPGQARQV